MSKAMADGKLYCRVQERGFLAPSMQVLLSTGIY
jgi:hypothetical protein